MSRCRLARRLSALELERIERELRALKLRIPCSIRLIARQADEGLFRPTEAIVKEPQTRRGVIFNLCYIAPVSYTHLTLPTKRIV